MLLYSPSVRHCTLFSPNSSAECYSSVVYLVVIVIYCHFNPPKGSAEPGEWHLVRFTPSFISTFPVQVFAFTCAQNVRVPVRLPVFYCLIRTPPSQLFPIYNELYSNTQERMNIVIGAALGGSTLTYEIISIFGYITFGSKVCPCTIDSVLRCRPHTSRRFALGRAKHHCYVPIDNPFHCSWPIRNCCARPLLLSASSPPLPKLPGQSVHSYPRSGRQAQTHSIVSH